MYKVRFHLAQGPNYMKWQVKSLNGGVRYFDPASVGLSLTNCTLHNQEKTATKIFNGSNKTVCAWIQCEKLKLIKIPEPVEGGVRLFYNPKKSVHWHTAGKTNLDKALIKSIQTYNTSIYAV